MKGCWYVSKVWVRQSISETIQNEVTRYYIMYLPNLEATQQLTRAEFKKYRDIHWGIECYHRALKQVCGI
jgi:hypothetical protein